MDAYQEMVRLGLVVSAIESELAGLTVAGRAPRSGTDPQSLRARLESMALLHAGTLLGAAVDHLRTVSQIAASRVIPAFALMSLIRTGYETSLLANWLVDEVDDDERLRRGVRAQYADLLERRRFESAIDRADAGRGKLAADRLSDLLTDALSLGVVATSEEGAPIAPAPPPSTTDLFDMYESLPPHGDSSGIKGQVYYRFLSGYAHGKTWALTLGVKPVGEPDAFGNWAGRITADDDRCAFLMSLATRRLVDAFSAYAKLCK